MSTCILRSSCMYMFISLIMSFYTQGHLLHVVTRLKHVCIHICVCTRILYKWCIYTHLSLRTCIRLCTNICMHMYVYTQGTHTPVSVGEVPLQEEGEEFRPGHPLHGLGCPDSDPPHMSAVAEGERCQLNSFAIVGDAECMQDLLDLHQPFFDF